MYGWGKNSFGQLGLNNQRNQNIPALLETLRSVKIKYISCGEDFSVFLTEVLFILLLFKIKLYFATL